MLAKLGRWVPISHRFDDTALDFFDIHLSSFDHVTEGISNWRLEKPYTRRIYNNSSRYPDRW